MSLRIDTQARTEAVRFQNQTGTPAAPSAGYSLLYLTSNGLYMEKSDGSVIGPFVTGTSSGYTLAPVMWHDQSIKTVGNAFATTVDSQQAYTYYTFQNTPANGDTWLNGFVCGAGTYTLHLMGYKDNNRGILDVYIDNSVVGSIDQYSAAPSRNQTQTIASIVLSAGYHQLKGVVNGKNGSSSSYFIALTKMWLETGTY